MVNYESDHHEEFVLNENESLQPKLDEKSSPKKVSIRPKSAMFIIKKLDSKVSEIKETQEVKIKRKVTY